MSNMEMNAPASALKGINILDLSWVAVGPTTVRYFADHGATVIHVESVTHPDVLRTSNPFKNGVPGLDRAGYFANYNANKYGMALNFNKPKAVEVAKELVKWADIVVESYVPGMMKRWGLDYEGLKKIKPEIIMASTSQQGQYGPYAKFRGFGAQGAVMAGFGYVVGWPDREPLGPYAAYTDFIAHRYLIISLLVALEHRRLTGKGTHIDQSQAESGIHFLATAMLDYQANGGTTELEGNADPYACPHGAFHCRGNDRWCVIAVSSEDDWLSLCQCMGNSHWAKDTKFSSFLSRKENEAELERLIEAWTVDYSPEEVMWILQAKGIAAGVVEKAEDLHHDPQLKHRHHFEVLEHPVIGPHTCDAVACRLSKTPAELKLAAPCLGQHSHFVFTRILGKAEEEFVSLLDEGIFE